MAIHQFALTPQRIGTIKGRILKHAVPQIYLGTVGVNEDFRKNQGQTVKYRRWLPKGSSSSQPNRFFLDGTGDRGNAYASAQLTTDGVTPAAETIEKQDITATLNQYSILYGYTDQTFDTYEDDIPKAMTELAGERMGLVNEMILFGVLKGCSNVFYGGTGTSRATVNGTISLTKLRKIARSLNLNHAEPIKKMAKMMKGNSNYGSVPVAERSFPVWVSTDLIPDLRDLLNFVPKELYSNPDEAVPGEIGKCEEFRFIASPELIEIQDSGAAVAGSSPALKSTTGTYADVYQVIVGSEDAWGHVGLNINSRNIAAITPGQTDKSDPLGQRGYVGCKWYYNAVILNDLQMAVYEVATRSLDD